MKRISWIDSLKGVLILFVVLGHVIGGAHHLSNGALSGTLNAVFLAIYMFHMPAFFLLAGHLVRCKAGDGLGFWQMTMSKVKRLLVPYFVFGFASVLIYWLLMAFGNSTVSDASKGRYFAESGWNALVAFGSVLYGANLPGTDSFRCNNVLWFLPCMFSVQLIDALISLLLRGKRNRIVDTALAVASLFVAAMLQAHPVPSLPYELHQVPWFYVYFLIGRCLPKELPCAVSLAQKKMAGLVLSGIVVLYFGVCLAFPCHNRQAPELFLQIGVLVLALLGIGTCGMMAQVFDSRWLMALGRASVGIMLMHKFVVVALQFGLMPVKSLFAHGAALCVLGIVIVTAVTTMVSYVVTILIRSIMPWALGERQ